MPYYKYMSMREHGYNWKHCYNSDFVRGLKMFWVNTFVRMRISKCNGLYVGMMKCHYCGADIRANQILTNKLCIKNKFCSYNINERKIEECGRRIFETGTEKFRLRQLKKCFTPNVRFGCKTHTIATHKLCGITSWSSLYQLAATSFQCIYSFFFNSFHFIILTRFPFRHEMLSSMDFIHWTRERRIYQLSLTQKM